MSEDPYAAKPWLKHYDEGVPEHIDYPIMNLYKILDNTANEFGNNTAIWFQKKKVSYKEFKDITDRLATVLKDLGVKKVKLLSNNPEKIHAVRDGGLELVERVPIEFEPSKETVKYLTVKKFRMGHLLSLV